MKTKNDSSNEPKITEASKALFLAYANDAGNWGGTPMVGGNVGGSKEERGNLTQLKVAGLITTFESDGFTWVSFTKAGEAYALENQRRARLEELRVALRSQSISYDELAELQGLAAFIAADDVELREAAGLPEFPEAKVVWPESLTAMKENIDARRARLGRME